MKPSQRECNISGKSAESGLESEEPEQGEEPEMERTRRKNVFVVRSQGHNGRNLNKFRADNHSSHTKVGQLKGPFLELRR